MVQVVRRSIAAMGGVSAPGLQVMAAAGASPAVASLAPPSEAATGPVGGVTGGRVISASPPPNAAPSLLDVGRPPPSAAGPPAGGLSGGTGQVPARQHSPGSWGEDPRQPR